MDNQKLSARVEALEGPDRSVDRVIKQAIGHEWDYSADWDYWDALKQEKASQPVAKPYTASLDAAMSLLNEHGCDLHIRPSATTVRCFPSEDDGIKVTAKTPALALCAAALKARGL